MEGYNFNLPPDDQVPHQVHSGKGDIVAAREYYIAMLEMDDRLQTMCIEEQRTMAKPMEVLEEVLFDDSRPE